MSDIDNYSWMKINYAKSLENKTTVKILWGNRSIYLKDWIYIKKFIKEFNIKKVLEYGVGLSSELMLLEECNILALETIEWWADHCKRALRGLPIKIEFYNEGILPDLKSLIFDLAFIDGPQHSRIEAIEHAKQYAPIIYLHNLRPNEVEKITEDPNWDIFEFNQKYKGHFFRRI